MIKEDYMRFPVPCLHLAAAAAIAILPAAAAAAEDDRRPEAPSGTSAQESSAEDERPVCRKMEVTGSRTRTQRVCMTRQEWRDFDRQNGY